MQKCEILEKHPHHVLSTAALIVPWLTKKVRAGVKIRVRVRVKWRGFSIKDAFAFSKNSNIVQTAILHQILLIHVIFGTLTSRAHKPSK